MLSASMFEHNPYLINFAIQNHYHITVLPCRNMRTVAIQKSIWRLVNYIYIYINIHKHHWVCTFSLLYLIGCQILKKQTLLLPNFQRNLYFHSTFCHIFIHFKVLSFSCHLFTKFVCIRCKTLIKKTMKWKQVIHLDLLFFHIFFLKITVLIYNVYRIITTLTLTNISIILEIS